MRKPISVSPNLAVNWVASQEGEEGRALASQLRVPPLPAKLSPLLIESLGA